MSMTFNCDGVFSILFIGIDQKCLCTFILATYCVAIFTLVGLSVLEAILVSFLFDLDGCCGEMAKSSVQGDIQLEVDSHKG